MNKNILTKIIINLLLLLFVVVWVLPTFGLFVSSFRDKDLLATSGWWTTYKTNEVNEIYRTKTFEDQIEESGTFFIKGNLMVENSGKKIISYGITSIDMNKYKSPLEPPLDPASPFPATLILVPSSTPFGIFTVTFSFDCTFPLPLHLLHGSLIISPYPLH